MTTMPHSNAGFIQFAHTVSEMCCRDTGAQGVSYYVHLVLDQGQEHSQAVVC